MKHTIITILLATLASIPTFGVENSAKPYPLDKCIVSDEKLGVEGKPVVFVHEGQEIKLCCQDCRKEFDANPSKFLAKLPKAEAPKAEPKKAGMDHKMMCACCAGDAKAADGKAAGHDHSSAAKQDDKVKSKDHSSEAKEPKPHDHDHAAAARPRADLDQALNFQGLQCFAHCAFADTEHLLQIQLARQFIAWQ